MTTSLLDLELENDTRPSKNIALSPFGYWPKSAWNRFCDRMRFSVRISFIGLGIIFFSMTGCSNSHNKTHTKLVLQQSETVISKFYRFSPSFFFTKAAMSVMVCALDELEH